jgi:hypothetical protein
LTRAGQVSLKFVPDVFTLVVIARGQKLKCEFNLKSENNTFKQKAAVHLVEKKLYISVCVPYQSRLYFVPRIDKAKIHILKNTGGPT